MESIQWRFQQGGSHALRDVFDGEVYRNHSTFFSHPFNVSFGMNYDGAPKFKSSSVQVWPVQMFVNELPPKKRLLNTVACSLRMFICILGSYMYFDIDFDFLMSFTLQYCFQMCRFKFNV